MEILEKVQQLKGELDALRPLDLELEAKIWQKFRLDWNYHSNKLEGNTYSFGETKMLLLKGLTAGGKPVRDHEEISGHDSAINFILDSIKNDEPLSEIFIRHLHKLILVRPFKADAKTADGKATKRLIKVGEYKTEPNHVETQTGEIFYFAEPIETPAKMQELVEWFRNKTELPDANPILLAAEFHYRFVRIHPFDDGNGRLARLLMNFVLMKYGYPPAIIKNEDKDNYIAVLKQADFNILEPFVRYISQNLASSLEIVIRGAKGESIEEPEDFGKELAIMDRSFASLHAKKPITKNSEVVLTVFDESIRPLSVELLTMCKKFDNFYKNTSFSLMINGASSHINEEDAIINTRDYLMRHVNNPEKFRFQYIHSPLNYEGFENTGWICGVNLTFELTKFTVEDDYGLNSLVKLYGQQLTHEEVTNIVQDLGKRHKFYLDEKMGEIQQVVNNLNKDIESV